MPLYLAPHTSNQPPPTRHLQPHTFNQPPLTSQLQHLGLSWQLQTEEFLVVMLDSFTRLKFTSLGPVSYLHYYIETSVLFVMAQFSVHLVVSYIFQLQPSLLQDNPPFLLAGLVVSPALVLLPLRCFMASHSRQQCRDHSTLTINFISPHSCKM